jgi:glyoxylase-like metal-dependent hydrolase (beta-lactamase superfamily II)
LTKNGAFMPAITLTSIEGNRQLLDGGAMFGNAPKPMWEKWLKPDNLNRVELACRGLLVQINDTNILLETGIGAFFEPKLASRYGVTPNNKHVLLDSLKMVGLEHTDIHYVILSHLHFDHAGGLLASYAEDPDRKSLLFPNAKYIVGQQAWKRAINPHGRDRASFIPEMISLLEESNRLIFIKPDMEDSTLPEIILENFRFFQSNGHTPGQLHTVVKTQSNEVVFCGDLIPGRAWTNTSLTMGYDRFPELLIDEKTTLYQTSNLDQTIFYYTHDSEFVASKIKLNEKGKYQAQELIKSFNKEVF